MQHVIREIKYKPLPSQQRFHDEKARFKIFVGPVGSGKSAALVQEVIKAAVLNPGLDGFVGAPTYRLLEDSTKPALIDVLVANEIPHKHSRSDNTIELSDMGTKILCRSMEDPERLRALNLAFFAVDELTYCREAAFLRLLGRLRHPGARRLMGFAACTPNGFDFVYDYFVGDKKTPDFAAVRAIPKENFYLARGYYETLARSYSENFYKQEVLGEFLSLQGGTAYYAFSRERNVHPVEYDPNCRLCWALDFNVNPMSSVIAQVRINELGKTLEVIDEVILRDANVNLACSAFIDRTQRWTDPDKRLKVNIYGDPAGNSRSHSGKSDWQLVWDFMARNPEYQMLQNIASSHSLVRDRVNAVNGALYNAVGETRLFINPRCKALIKDFERVTWAKDSHGNTLGELRKTEADLTHVSDAAGYMIERELPLASRTRISVI